MRVLITDVGPCLCSVIWAADLLLLLGLNLAMHFHRNGDWNADGKLDLVASVVSGTTFAIRLGNGDGTFAVPSASVATAPLSPFAFVAADLNRDGKLDVAVAMNTGSNQSPTVGVALGAGNGSFGPLTRLALPAPGLVGVADCNGDNRPDIVSLTAAQVIVFPGKGDGSFGAAVSSPTNDFGGLFALADMDLDGRADIVAGGPAIEVLLGNGDGTFRDPVAFPTADRVGGFTVADFDQDGRPDVAYLDATNGTHFTVLLNTSH